MAETAMAAAMKAGGMDTEAARLYTLTAEFIRKAGGNRAMIEMRLGDALRHDGDLLKALMRPYIAGVERDMKGLPGEAIVAAPLGQSRIASSRQQNGDAGRTTGAEKANYGLPASPVNRDGKGHSAFASEGHVGGARPVREPSVADLSAMREVRRVATSVTLTVMDSWKIRDGRSLGDVTFGELESLRFENAREASIIRQIQRHGTADPSAKVRDVIKVDDLQRMIQRAAEVADAA